jgi:diguanylate cyclase (GGDEF)-like protein
MSIRYTLAVATGLVNRAFDWLSSPPTRESAKVRARLIDTLYDRKAFILFGTLSVAMLAVSAAVFTGGMWPWFWLAADLLLLVYRLRTIERCERAKAAGLPPPVRGLMLGGATWCLLLGAGSAACIVSGHAGLLLLAGVNVAAVIGAISSRNAATPRYAVLAIALVSLPFAVSTLFSPVPGAFLAGLQFPLHIAGIVIILARNYESHVRLVRAELRNRQLARTDPLTGLPNRAALNEALGAHCAALSATGLLKQRSFAVLSIDLDGFKAVNDRHGHAMGDSLLIMVADRLQKGIRPRDQVFRPGGDEFVVVMPEAGFEEADYVARRLIEKLSLPFQLRSGDLAEVGTSVGSAFAPEDGATPDALLAHSDHALYVVKRSGKGRHMQYSAVL